MKYNDLEFSAILCDKNLTNSVKNVVLDKRASIDITIRINPTVFTKRKKVSSIDAKIKKERILLKKGDIFTQEKLDSLTNNKNFKDFYLAVTQATVGYSWISDKKIWENILSHIRDHKQASREFQRLYIDDLYIVAQKYHDITRYGGKPDTIKKRKEELFHTTKNNKKIPLTNDTQRAYVWAFNKAKRLSCKYDPAIKLKQSLRRYIFVELGMRSKVIDFIRHAKGSVQHTPDYIRKKGEDYASVVKLKLEQKHKDEICIALKMDVLRYNEIIEDEGVRKYLKKRDRLIDNQKKKYEEFHHPEEDSLSRNTKEGDEIADDMNPALKDHSLSVEDQFYLDEEVNGEIDHIMHRIFSKQERAIFHLMLRDFNKLENDKMILFIKQSKTNILKRLKIETSNDLNSFLEDAITKFYRALQKSYPDKEIKRKEVREKFDEYYLDFYSSSSTT